MCTDLAAGIKATLVWVVLVFAGAAGCNEGNSLRNTESISNNDSVRDSRSNLLPSDEVMDRVEAILTSDDCIGDLDQWERLYAYSLNHSTRATDPNVIEFDFREAGVHGFNSGRRAVELFQLAEIDDRDYRSAFGRFTVSTGRIDIRWCDPKQR
jgi:hypothetical protein